MSRHHPPATDAELVHLLGLVPPAAPQVAAASAPAALLDGDDDDAPGSPRRDATLQRLGVPVRP